MSNIQFEEGYNQVNTKYYNNASGDRGMVAWLIKKGIVKDAKTAQIVLLIIALLFFVMAFYFPTRNSSFNYDADFLNSQIQVPKDGNLVGK